VISTRREAYPAAIMAVNFQFDNFQVHADWSAAGKKRLFRQL